MNSCCDRQEERRGLLVRYAAQDRFHHDAHQRDQEEDEADPVYPSEDHTPFIQCIFLILLDYSRAKYTGMKLWNDLNT
jgi:hypothetical protein